MIPSRVLSIIQQVAHEHGVTAADLIGRDQRTRFDEPRKAAMRAVRWMDFGDGRRPSYPQIGRWFDNRDHTTIMAACAGYEPPREEQLELALELAG